MKTKALLLALCALSFSTRAQITGQRTYDHGGNPAVLSAGTYVNFSPGFVMAGYVPNTTTGAANFYVDKVNGAGAFTGGFSNEYLFSTFCYNGQWTQELNCYGISLIPTSGGRYALTAAFDSGCLFGFLTSAGAVGFSDHFAFPTGATNISKPVITESTSSPTEFYVCGSYLDANNVWYMYAFRFDATGAVSWNQQYDLGSSGMLVPYGIVEGNYNGAELAVAGTVFNGASTMEDAFFMLLDGSTGAVNLYEEIDYWGGGSPDIDYCTSISLSTVNSGYIIGGSTTNSTGLYWPIFEQLNSNGSFNWIMNPWPVHVSSHVVDIEERFSTFYNQWEYYGTLKSTNGMMVMKIRNGSVLLPGFSQFYYATNIGADAVCLSLNNTSSSPNRGIHVFGTSNTGDFVLDQACFNGATANCPSTGSQELLTGPGWTYWSNTHQPKAINTSAGLGKCYEAAPQIVVNPITYPVNTICSQSGSLPSSPYTGNNNRTGEITGVSEASLQDELFNIYPNPVRDRATIHYQLDDNSTVKVELYNNLGQLITTLEDADKNAGTYDLTLDMKELGIETGVYFVKVNYNGENRLQKLVYSGNN